MIIMGSHAPVPSLTSKRIRKAITPIGEIMGVRVKNRRVSVKMVALIRKAFWGCYTYLLRLVIGCDLGIPTPQPLTTP